MKKRKATPNLLLYAHVTRVGFDLSLGRTHIAALVYLDLSMERHRHDPPPLTSPYSGAFRNFIGGITGLIGRGLVIHHFDGREYRHRDGFKKSYTITPAGTFVIGLLKEAGIYDEYAGALVEAKAS